MKVLMVNKFLHPAGGAETYLFKIGEYLENSGCETEYFGMYDSENTVGNRWGIYTDAVDFHKKNLLSFAVKPFKVIYSGEARSKMKQLLQEFQPDVLHINNFNYQLTPSILMAADEYCRNGHGNLRIVYTAHDPLLADKTVVLRNFVRPISGEGKTGGKYVLYFGRFSEEKGIRTLLQACRELPDIPFVFAGGGPLEHLLEETDNVTNVGFLKDKELDRVIQGARFSVCPSVCNENCPFSVIESLMHGTPVLGSDRGGIPELIQDGKTGWIFKAGDSVMLRKKIREIWDSSAPEEFGKMCTEIHFDSLGEYGHKLMRLYTAAERM